MNVNFNPILHVLISTPAIMFFMRGVFHFSWGCRTKYLVVSLVWT